MNSRYNKIDSLPIAMFHLIIIITSMIEAQQPMTVVKISTFLKLQPLKKFWYIMTPKKLTTELNIPLTVF